MMRLNLTKRVLRLWLVILVTLTISVGLKLANTEPPLNEPSEFESANAANDSAHLDITLDEILAANKKRDALVFTEIPEHAMAPSTRYRIEFTATTADFYPYRPFDYYHVDGWIVTAPEGVVCSVDYRPAVPITYIKGWSSAEREQRTGITTGYTHREGVMYLTLRKKLLFARSRTKAASLSVSEQWSVSENNKPERLEPIVQVLHTAPYFEQLQML